MIKSRFVDTSLDFIEFVDKKKSFVKGGPGSGSWEAPGDPRFEREDSGKVSWESTNSKLEANKQFKEKFNINRVKGDIKTINNCGKFLSDFCNRSPGFHERLLSHRLSEIVFQDGVLVGRSGSQHSDAIGLYEPKTGFGAAGRISIQTFTNDEKFYNDLRPSRSQNVASGVGACLTHELGHHVFDATIRANMREKWSDTIDKLGGAKKLIESVSRYATTESKDTFAIRDLKIVAKKEFWYQEGFAESFCKFTNPEYKGDLPKPIHDFIGKILTPRKKNNCTSITKQWKEYLRGNDNANLWTKHHKSRF